MPLYEIRTTRADGTWISTEVRIRTEPEAKEEAERRHELNPERHYTVSRYDPESGEATPCLTILPTKRKPIEPPKKVIEKWRERI